MDRSPSRVGTGPRQARHAGEKTRSRVPFSSDRRMAMEGEGEERRELGGYQLTAIGDRRRAQDGGDVRISAWGEPSAWHRWAAHRQATRS
jgi:hypothetical protein